MKSKLIACLLLLLAGAFVAARGQATGTSAYRLSLPLKEWALDVTVPTPPTFVDSFSDDRRTRTLFLMYAAGSEPTFIYISLMPAGADGGATEFRNFEMERLKDKGRAHGFKLSEYNNTPVASYQLAKDLYVGNSPSGAPVTFLNPPRVLAAFMANKDVWMEIYISKKTIKADDEKLFYSILDSAKVADTSTPSTSFDFYWKGKPLYLIKAFRKAIEFYSRAFELEQKERRLDAKSWHLMVRELSDSYWAIGDAGRAKETLDLAILQEPTYPMFHYGLARMYGVSGDMENAIASLERAFANQANADRLDRLLAPLSDPAFKSFWKDEKFRSATRKMQSESFRNSGGSSEKR